VNEQRLSARDVALLLGGGLLLGGPAMAMVEFQIGPGRWIVAVQDRFLGFHFVVSSMAILMLGELLAIGAIVVPLAVLVRKVTGKTIAEWLRPERQEL